MFDGRRAIIDIDNENKTVYFDTYKLKKITGTRVGPILNISKFSTPFKVACEIAGLYPGDKSNKYMEAGNIIEPVLRKYAAENVSTVSEMLGFKDSIEIEKPVEANKCGYDHFHNEKLFGGLVDGYVLNNGSRNAMKVVCADGCSQWGVDA